MIDMEKTNKAISEICDKICEFNENHIIDTAYDAYVANQANGIAVYDPKTGELFGISLRQNEFEKQMCGIYVYEVDANLHEQLDTLDILDEDERQDMYEAGLDLDSFANLRNIDLKERIKLALYDFAIEHEELSYDNIKNRVLHYFASLPKK